MDPVQNEQVVEPIKGRNRPPAHTGADVGRAEGEAEEEPDGVPVAVLDKNVVVAEGEPEGDAVADDEPDGVVEAVDVGDTDDVAEGRAEAEDDLVPDDDGVSVKGMQGPPLHTPHRSAAPAARPPRPP